MAINKRIIRSNDEGGAGGASFNTVIYTGTGTNQQVTGVGFEPDFVWIKSRTTTNPHVLHDTVRGIGNVLYSNLTNAEGDESPYFTGVGDGFLQFGINAGNYNNTGTNYVAWCWKAGGAAVTNTDGTITSQVSANPAAGFSIVSYTGTDVNNTIGHGLGIAPNVIIFKDRTIGRNWRVYHSAIGAGQNLKLNTSLPASSDAAIFQSTTPNENVFYVGASGDVNANTDNFIAYCFAEVAGFSKFGSFTGNGVSGRVIDCAFEPAFVLVKRTNGEANWVLFDNKRNGDPKPFLLPNDSAIEATVSTYTIQMVSNGFRIDVGNTGLNATDADFIYMAFANQF